MNRTRKASLVTAALRAAMVLALVSVAGCGPDLRAVNNKLRAEKMGLGDQIQALQHQAEADHAAIVSLQERVGTLPTLPQDRLDKLVLPVAIELGRLTGGANLDRPVPGDHGVKVYAVPIDRQGDEVKMAGTFAVELRDPQNADHPLVGHWTFDLAQTRADWYDAGLLYTYILPCPWPQPPAHQKLTLVVTFFDELTQRALPTVTKDVTVELPPTPTTGKAASRE